VNPPTDTELIDSCRSGRVEAFGQLVERYQPRLYCSLIHFLGSREDAADVSQEALILAFQKLHTYRGQSSFYSWLYRIAVNAAVSAHRKQRRVRCSLDARREDRGEEPAVRGEDAEPAYRLEQEERRQLVQTALAGLTPEFRTAVVLKEIDGLRYEEIAVVLDCPVGTVRSRIHRGRLELRERLRSLLSPSEREELPSSERVAHARNTAAESTDDPAGTSAEALPVNESSWD
jgi:RNA polymerase sigma-70 factor, ECF subfamily